MYRSWREKFWLPFKNSLIVKNMQIYDDLLQDNTS